MRPAVPKAAIGGVQPLVLALQRLQARARLRHRLLVGGLAVRVSAWCDVIICMRYARGATEKQSRRLRRQRQATHVPTSCWNMLSTAARRSLIISNSLPPAELAAAADSSPTSEMYLQHNHAHAAAHITCELQRQPARAYLCNLSRNVSVACVSFSSNCAASACSRPSSSTFSRRATSSSAVRRLLVRSLAAAALGEASSVCNDTHACAHTHTRIHTHTHTRTQTQTLISSCIADFSAAHCLTQSSRSTLSASSSSFRALISLANLKRSSAHRASNSTLHT